MNSQPFLQLSLLVTGISCCFETASGQIARRIITRGTGDIHEISEQ
jgi:hypothetical protein